MTEPNWSLHRKKPRLEKRALLLRATRSFFCNRGYLEVDTPGRIPANAPEPHIDAMTSDGWALQTSPELAMKRMLAAGYEKIFQLCHVWRSGERGQYHLPEFTMLEWYRTGVNYRDMMTECTELLLTLVPEGRLSRRGKTIDLTPPWEQLSVAEAFDRYATSRLDEALAQDCFEEVLTDQIVPHLGVVKPTFLIDFPTSMASLARIKMDNPLVAERFELFLDGVELANAFSELIDPQEQQTRFVADEALRRNLGKPALPLPDKFLHELKNMPEAAGIALGFDRLAMILTDADSIDEVVCFSPEDL